MEHCPREQMWTDINTKPKQGAVLFREFRAQMMGIEPDYNNAFYQNRIYVRPPDSPVGFNAPIRTGEPIMSPGRTMLPVPQTNSIASQECVGEQRTDGRLVLGSESPKKDRRVRFAGDMPTAEPTNQPGSTCANQNGVKQGGHTGVDNWPWPGGHSTWSSPTLFMVSY